MSRKEFLVKFTEFVMKLADEPIEDLVAILEYRTGREVKKSATKKEVIAVLLVESLKKETAENVDIDAMVNTVFQILDYRQQILEVIQAKNE